jgi:hypothetical protein
MLVQESPPAGLNQREQAVLRDLLDRAVAGG